MASKLPPNPIGVAPGSSYWNDWYEKLRKLIDSGFAWSSITGTPTTLPGYGITTGITGSVTLAKITLAGTNGSITYQDGLITAVVAPT
jgi:hypothetical protein